MASLFGALRSTLGTKLFISGAAGAATLTALQSGWLKDARAEQAPPAGALDPNEWRSFKVVSKDVITHNTSRLRFATPDPNQTSGLFVASCLLTRAPIGAKKEDGNQKFVIRPYTPTSAPDQKGHFDLVVKGYPDGKMSKHIVNLNVGDSLECKGPISKLRYKPNMKKKIGMIAGGTGITPMLQVASEVLRNPDDKTEVSLVFGNVSEDDILLRKEIDEMAKKHSNFKVYYVVDKPTSFFWRGGKGYITEDTVKKHLPPPSDVSLILVCGPPPLMKAISGDKAEDKSQGELTGTLKSIGYTSDQVYKF
ncbi:cytochrome-b5 reductase like protein [Coccomyxa subellipsoidea C-169]|uniref:NADH-cytochrome b5 reductase n=1 Tax=Coccomyxa subellipsoidea (strain C-169) TaxID=574566 RepID=I0YS43_COCSC|nr:cytochrome-b5 reductase like protein [Coccomyxa subellipsoidea C-169]EIE21212.1 cytochrome-b5 reductase like protein [Coccomyxa subellipsoidea C-169]|eukprot:XP_005645756.1 cytochrome-b5 reductase like protein [Coccomyxa subellipsoidea C-169]